MEKNKEKVELALAIEEALSKLRKLMVIVKKRLEATTNSLYIILKKLAFMLKKFGKEKSLQKRRNLNEVKNR